MARYMNRSNNLSTYDTPVGPYQFVELVYTTVGPQEWIFLPDMHEPVEVVISFPEAGAAVLQGTASPPNVILGNTIPKSSFAGPVVYDITEELTDTVRLSIQGPTAIRVNALGGHPQISIRS